jgi:HD-GYP domain-containing protein (c-di-GMP phosphodiesterase class II)
MKTYVFMKDELQSDLVSLAIEFFFKEITSNCPIKKEEFVSLIKGNHEAALFVSDQISANELQEFSKLTNTFVCAIGNFDGTEFDRSRATTVKSIQRMTEFMGALSRVCPSLRPAPENRFCKISVKTLLLNRGKFNVDVFIRLSDTKYVKAINIGDSFTAQDFKKYYEKNISFFYIRSSDFLILVDDWMTELKMLGDTINNYDPEKIVDSFSAIHESIHYMIPDEGFTPAMQQLANQSISLAIAVINKNPKMAELISLLKEKKVPYISAHSTAVAFLSCKLAVFMDWSNETTFFKLGMASYIHDLTLEKDEYSLLDTKNEVLSSQFSENEKKHILTHSKTAAALLKGDMTYPLDVSFIVEQHHERADGEGFPKGVTTEISPISALFILAHDIVAAMYRTNEGFDLKRFFRLPEVAEKYSRGNSAKVFKTIKDKILSEAG